MTTQDGSTPVRKLARWVLAGVCGVMTLGVGLSAWASVGLSEAPVGFVDEHGNAEPSRQTLASKQSSPSPVAHAPVRSADEPTSPAGSAVSSTETLFTLRTTKTSANFARTGVERRRMTVTAYCACTRCCGEGAKGITASGKKVTHNGGRFVAADTSVLPFGTRVRVPGYGQGKPVEVVDRGGAIEGDELDVFFKSHEQALKWGRQVLWVEVQR